MNFAQAIAEKAGNLLGSQSAPGQSTVADTAAPVPQKPAETPSKPGKFHNIPVELSTEDIELIRYVVDRKLTLTTVPRLVATLKACRYAVENDLPRDFVECGVWRGGNGILAKRIFEATGSDKKVWMTA